MAMEFLRVDPRFDEHPDVEAAGWCAGRVFEHLLKVSARLDLEGCFDAKRADPAWLARRWNLTDEELGTGEGPADFVARGTKACLAHGLLEPLGVGGFCIPGWEKWYRPAKTGAQRQAEYDDRQRQLKAEAARQQASGLTDLTEPVISDATPHHTTPLHETPQKKKRDAPAVADAAPVAAEGQEGGGRGPHPVQAAWNADAHADLPRWREMTDGRRRAAGRRPLEGETGWRAVIARINASPFCRGQNDRGWRADPDWLLKSGNAAKVLEGRYDARDSVPSGPEPARCAFPGCHYAGMNLAMGLCYPHMSDADRAIGDGMNPLAVAAWLQGVAEQRVGAG